MTMSQTNLPDQNAGNMPTPQAPQTQGSRPAWKCPRSYILLGTVAAVGLAGDLISKHLAFSRLQDCLPLIRGILSFDRSLNFGALFGIGRGMTVLFVLASFAAVIFVAYMFVTSHRRQWIVHMALGLVLAGALGNLYDRLFVRVALLTQNGKEVCHGLLVEDHRPEYVRIDSIPGNGRYPAKFLLQDRNGDSNGRTLLQPTAVRDFIRVDVALKSWPVWPWIFNVADSMLVVGVGLLLIIYWRVPAARESRAIDPSCPSTPCSAKHTSSGTDPR